MRTSLGFRSPAHRLGPFAAVALLAALFAAGCSRDSTFVELADFVAHQAGSVTTDRISPRPGEGVERLESGWHFASDDATGEPHLEIAARQASLRFFSLTGQVEAVEVEASLAPEAAAAGRHRLKVRLNDRKIPGRQVLRAGRHRYRFELPGERIVSGENFLQFSLQPTRARTSPRSRSPVHIHGFAIYHAGERPPRRQLPERITVVEPPESRRGKRVVQIPAGGRLDLVTPIPEGGRLEGRLIVEPGPRGGELEAEVTLLDDTATEHPLHRVVTRQETSQRLRLPLEPWAGRLARLRIRFAGADNGVLRLENARITSRQRAAGSAPPAAPSGLSSPQPSSRLAGSDLVVILLDAARADVFSPYGSPHPTPAVARLAEAGTRFARARAPSSWTGQSIPSLFTGLYPDSAGMEHWGSRLPEPVPTLAERFQERGYQTVLWTQHPFYKSQRELQRGFQRVLFGRNNDPTHLPTAEELVVGEAPLFAFVHLMPPHTPYEPPQPFAGSLSSWYTGSLKVTARTLNAFPKRRSPAELSADDLRYIRDRYQENVLFADSLVGQVLTLLEEAGRYDNATIVLTSDHGEAFLEHGRFLHGLHLFNEFVHVPWIVKWPRAAAGYARVIEPPVGLADLAPTLADAYGLEVVPGFQGASLLPAVFDGAPVERPVYAYTRGISDGTRPPRPKHRIEQNGWTLVVDHANRANRLYRSATDPAEEIDLAAEELLRTLLLRQQALLQAAFNQQLADSLGRVEARELDAETVERLKALGYL